MNLMQHNVILKNILEYWKPVTFAVLLVLMIVTIHDGHNWGGDFSQYIHHAVNLVNGVDYADIGYIHNVFAFVGPSAYPPVFPFVLAAIYALFGLNFIAFKVFVVISFISALYLYTNLLKDKLSDIYQFVFVIVLALNPYFWLQKDKVLSDYFFMLLVFAIFILFNRRYTLTAEGYIDTKTKNWVYAVLIGVLLYLSYATREVGIVFIPTILVFELFHFKKIKKTTLVSIVVFVVLAGLQQKMINAPVYNAERGERLTSLARTYGKQSADVSHKDFITLDLVRVKKQIIQYIESIRGFWHGSDSLFVKLSGWVAMSILLLFALAGYIKSLLNGPHLIDIFIAGYIAVLLLFAGIQGLRYLIPVIPIFFLYAFSLHELLLNSKYKKGMIAVAAVFLTTTLVSYASSDLYGKDTSLGVTSPDAAAFFNYVRHSTPEDSIFVFQKPRVLTLLTQRQASAKPGDRGGNFMINYMDAIGATYLVHSNMDFHGGSRPVAALTLPSDDFALVFNNNYFYVYKKIKKQGAD